MLQKVDCRALAKAWCCGFILSNFNIFSNNTPNNSCYGTASLVKSDLNVSNIHTDDQGRVIVFNAAGCTWANVYLPSGSAAPARLLREKYGAKIIPQLISCRLAHGAIGRDFNCISSVLDSTHEPQRKISPSIRNLISAMTWTDSFKLLDPRARQYSQHYNFNNKNAVTRLDQSYHWGDLKPLNVEYVTVSFSDHLSLRVSYKLPGELDRQLTLKYQLSFKIPPHVVDDELFRTRLRDSMTGWQLAKSEGGST